MHLMCVRYMPGGPPARVVADGFQRPNGLSLTADQKIMYVSDTGMASGAADAVRLFTFQLDISTAAHHVN